MAIGWSGPDPVAFTDPPGSTYELGTKYTANGDLTVTHVRVWAGPTSVAVANRKGRIWSAAGVQLGIATLVNSLPSGWSQYALDVPLTITAGTTFWVTYSVLETYGANTTPGYPRNSADNVVTAAGGGLNTAQGSFPGTFPNTFYGVDIVYTAGNQAPVAGITVVATAELTAQATLTIQDESPTTCTSLIEWGDGATTNAGNGLGPFTHVYVGAGTYAVMVTTTDSTGLKDSAAAPVTVVAPHTGMNIAAVMDAVSTRLSTIAGLRCHAHPVGSVTPPAAVVSYPDEYKYDETYGRGMDRMTLPVVLVVGKVVDRSARNALSAYAAGAGLSSVKRVLESGTYSAFHTIRVSEAEFDVVSIAAVDYIAATFGLDIAGQGST